MLLKGLSEVQSSPRPLASAEMVLVRLAYAADLPTPDEALRLLANKDYRPPMPTGAGSGPSTPPDAVVPPGGDAQAGMPSAPMPSGGPTGSSGPTALQAGSAPTAATPKPDFTPGHAEPVKQEKANLRLVASQSETELAKQPPQAPRPTATPTAVRPVITRFEQIVALADKNRDIALKVALEHTVRPVSTRPGRLMIGYEGADSEAFIAKLGRKLTEWTGERWNIELIEDAGGATLTERKEERERQVREEADNHPLVEAVRSLFPGSKIVDVRINRDFNEEFLAPAPEDMSDDEISDAFSINDADELGLDDDF